MGAHVYVCVCVCAYVNGLFVCMYMYVNQPLFYRYTHLVEESQLDSIPGMVYCPRPGCNKRTVSDPKENLAVCSVCDLPFCKLCRQVYHGMGPCPARKKVQWIINPLCSVSVTLMLILTPSFMFYCPGNPNLIHFTLMISSLDI